MTEIKTTEKLALAARLVLGGIFLFSGINKALAPEDFEAVLEAYYILPPQYLSLFSQLIPWGELLVGLCLASGYAARLAALASAGMLATFVSAILYTRWRGIPLDNCGCFGAAVHFKPWQAVVLDLTLIAASVAAWRAGPGPWSLDRWIERGT